MKLGPYELGSSRTPQAGIYEGDAAVLSGPVPDESVDLILTDPPYDKASVPLYWLAAEIAGRVLKPGGALVMMAGGLYTHQIHHGIPLEPLIFFYTWQLEMKGQTTGLVHPHGSQNPTVTRHKDIICFTKGWGRPRTVSYNPIVSHGPDKRFHNWGQSAGSTRYMIELWTKPGDVVLDLYAGGGTTGLVAGGLGRHWLMFDHDPAAIDTMQRRLAGEDIPLLSSLSFAQQMGMNLPVTEEAAD